MEELSVECKWFNREKINMGAYIWEKSIFGAFEHFETFLISNGPMDHAEFSQHIKNLTSQKELVTNKNANLLALGV